MLRNLFKRPMPDRDVDTLIRDIADHQRAKDYSELFRVLPNLKLFLPLAGKLPTDLPRGGAFQVEAQHQLKAFTALVQGRTCVLVFTSRDNPNFGANYVEIIGDEVMHMVLKLSDVDGLLVQSTGTGWVGLDKQKISDLLSKRV
jgi:hypothetical protein